jgi:hypothetical protein
MREGKNGLISQIHCFYFAPIDRESAVKSDKIGQN